VVEGREDGGQGGTRIIGGYLWGRGGGYDVMRMILSKEKLLRNVKGTVGRVLPTPSGSEDTGDGRTGTRESCERRREERVVEEDIVGVSVVHVLVVVG
jgi:hypothetical protein